MSESVALPHRFAVGAFGLWLAISVGWWVLAFAPLPVPPEWLDEARAVCFGSSPSGLPDNYGWVLLVLGPLSMLGFLLAVWGRELGSGFRALSRRSWGVALIVWLAAGLVGGGVWVARRVDGARRAAAAYAPLVAEERLPAGYPRGTDPAPELRLVDQSGTTVELSALAGKTVLVSFAFAHCVTVCPMLIGTLHAAIEGLPPARVAVVVITLDPWRDTPGSLPGIAAAWKLDRIPDARVLSGEVADVNGVLEAWGAGGNRDEATGEISHPGLIYVLDRQSRIAFRFLNPPRGWLIDAVARLEREAG
jgi:cytochrome oxidase Cu insertion factor (SCO1/SenC/PrrC family)